MENTEKTITVEFKMLMDLFGLAAAYQDAVGGGMPIKVSDMMLTVVGVGPERRAEVLNYFGPQILDRMENTSKEKTETATKGFKIYE